MSTNSRKRIGVLVLLGALFGLSLHQGWITIPDVQPVVPDGPSIPDGPVIEEIAKLDGSAQAKREAAAAWIGLAEALEASPGTVTSTGEAKVLIDRWQRLLAPHVEQRGGIPGFGESVRKSLERKFGEENKKLDQSDLVEFAWAVARSLLA